MKTRDFGQPWQLIPLLGIGLVVAFVISTAAGAGATAGPAQWHAGAPLAETVAAAAAAAPAKASPADLAIQLEARLGQHSVLAADLMRSRIRGDDDFVQAANAALAKNTDAMTGVISGMFGEATGKKFAPLWSQHIVQLFAYAGALADNDAVAQKNARAELQEYEADLGGFFATASKGRLPKAAADAAVKMHVQHLTMQADAYAKKDYTTADKLYQESYGHTYDLGLVLANALLPTADRAVLQQPLWRLRSQLGKLLTDHAVLIEDVTRAAVTNAPDFTAAGAEINQNSTDLMNAIGVLFGSAAATQFGNLWGEHVDALVSYSSAVGAKDTAKQDAAKAKLTEFEGGMSKLLSAAAGNKVPPSAMAAALQMHDQMLMQHADAYGKKDYTSAHNIGYDTYNHMIDLAQTLANAFGESVAEKLPKGGPQTGYGGAADYVEHH
jgi:hypothetical protein